MTWYAFLYNKVSDSVTNTQMMGDKESIPEFMFDEVAVNGELELYYAQVYVSGELKWGAWHKKHKQWFFADVLPDVVKLARLLAQ
jgi:hypothetical protein